MEVKEKQTTKILKLLQAKKRVTNRELNSICWRYSARIYDLRKDGYIIVPTHVKDSLWTFTFKGHRDDESKEYAD